jgi:hypothetical protein
MFCENFFNLEFGDQKMKTTKKITALMLGVITCFVIVLACGKQTLVVRDVDTTNLPTTITNGSANVVAWKDKTPFSRSNSLAKALNQTTNQDTTNKVVS